MSLNKVVMVPELHFRNLGQIIDEHRSRRGHLGQSRQQILHRRLGIDLEMESFLLGLEILPATKRRQRDQHQQGQNAARKELPIRHDRSLRHGSKYRKKWSITSPAILRQPRSSGFPTCIRRVRLVRGRAWPALFHGKLKLDREPAQKLQVIERNSRTKRHAHSAVRGN